MFDYKIVIPTAGKGSRLEGFSRYINKSLVTVAYKPIISHIIEKFPTDITIVVPLGYKKESVREYLQLAHPDREFQFIEIDKYEGEGTGLGYTLLSSKQYLQCPFIFCSNDTIVLEDIPNPDENWMGYAESEDNSQYRSVRIDGDKVYEICSKGATGDIKAYIGMAGIKNYEEFWEAMENGKNEGAYEIGESYGLRFLLEREIEAKPFTWFDTGNIDALQKTREYFRSEEEPNILEKDNEAIWFVNDMVIKYSTDSNFIKNRVKRADYLGNYVPRIISSSESMYTYKMVPGKIFSKAPKRFNFEYFLDWMDEFWEKKELSEEQHKQFKQICMTFYKEKTYQRVKAYFTRFEQIDTQEIINRQQIPKLYNILEKIDWDHISEGMPTAFHGDLHFENILINEQGRTPFTLLDWRQDFAGLIEYGDVYYDLAKLNHGLIISHELIGKDLYHVDRRLNIVNYDFLRKQSLVECENYFKEYLVMKGYELDRMEIITSLIFLNIAALHHYPYSMLLFYLGKSMLFNLIKEDYVASSNHWNGES
ncbi:MAG: hypothetical protein H8D96_13540 [Desulfobacterales bacterium]|uniref:Aminoglycoside phosphotransferase domain-containing protein n=1 Tax=Candidatus Desulfatibia vada TaxID=2841696 RepID=A0A8J6NUY2_9BACT|nr:hypothetical protein [Candidatus Desulfatibia vada]